MKTSILIGGDTCPIGRNQSLFQEGDAASLLNDLLPEFDRADLSMVNLECPLVRKKAPIEKCGPNLGVPMDCVNGLQAMGIDLIGLANNHIMDHGAQGLQTTIETLDEHEILHVGAARTLKEARKILVQKVNEVRIGILAVAEHEFGIAEKHTPGANPINLIDCVRNINEHHSEYDKLIVLVHGGNELYQYPRPNLMDTCRFLVEQGADAVICQHSHCAGCMETYLGAPIVYGQGNFLFDHPSKTVTWHDGVLICLETDDQGKFKIRLIPYRQSDGNPGARRMTKHEEVSFLKGFFSRSEAIRDEAFVARQWDSFCQDNKRYYLHSLHGRPGILRRLAGKFNLLHFFDSLDIQRLRLNLIRCQSHREALVTVLARETERK